jgi:LysR family transcriptional regulator, glycine cleavage system transcriptional activator
MNSSSAPLLSVEAITVLIAAERGSLSAAARRVRAVERALGIVLFDRMAKGLRLTPDGEILVATLRRAQEVIEGAFSGATGPG